MDNTIKGQKYFWLYLGHFLTVALTWPLNKLFSRALSSLSLKKKKKRISSLHTTSDLPAYTFIYQY